MAHGVFKPKHKNFQREELTKDQSPKRAYNRNKEQRRTRFELQRQQYEDLIFATS